MKFTQTCPKCSGKRFAVNGEVRVPEHDSANGTWPFFAITVAYGPGRFPSEKPTRTDREYFGHFESWICLGCGYTEFYAAGLDYIDEIAQRWPEQVRIVDASPPKQGPYR